MPRGLVILWCLLWAGIAQANLNVARQVLDQPAVVGQARLKVLLFKVYDATLYAPKGRYQDPEFGRQFFAIWLGEKTSEPAMRRQLLKLTAQ